ncbi:sulfurtransferase TusE, partial [Francisella tularensis subsp. holarctica]|nr:sulfurtransferase TusE [Francisella tularensis subsp. holarctica]
MDNYNTEENGFLLDIASWDMDFCIVVAAL